MSTGRSSNGAARIQQPLQELTVVSERTPAVAHISIMMTHAIKLENFQPCELRQVSNISELCRIKLVWPRFFAKIEQKYFEECIEAVVDSLLRESMCCTKHYTRLPSLCAKGVILLESTKSRSYFFNIIGPLKIIDSTRRSSSKLLLPLGYEHSTYLRKNDT